MRVLSVRPDLIFVQWLNPEILAFYGIRHRIGSRDLQRVARLLGRWGILVAQRGVVLPYTYLHEVAEIDAFLRDLHAAQLFGLVHVTSSSPVAADVVAKKRHEYRAELELFPRYAPDVRLADLSELDWLPRTGTSASGEITSLWLAGLEQDGGVWWEILSLSARRGLFRHFGRIEERIAAVPDKLDGQAFIARFALPLIGLDLEIADRSRVAELVSRGYLRSYLAEPPSALFTDTPIGPLDCGLRDDPSICVISLRQLRELATHVGVVDALDGRIPLSRLLSLRSDPVWTWFIETALNDQRLVTQPLREAMLAARVPAAAPARDLASVRDRLWSFEEAVRPYFGEIMADAAKDEHAASPPSSGGIAIYGSITAQNVAVGGDVTQLGSQGTVTVEQAWPELSTRLLEAGLPGTELEELRKALAEDLPARADDENPGRATRKWFARIARGVGTGAYSVGVELIAAAIKAHTGLHV